MKLFCFDNFDVANVGDQRRDNLAPPVRTRLQLQSVLIVSCFVATRQFTRNANQAPLAEPCSDAVSGSENKETYGEFVKTLTGGDGLSSGVEPDPSQRRP